jgi:signal transduction histidine kinase
VETDFGELPRVLCHGGDLNQVILNLVVNAAHAVGDVVAGAGGKGRITVRTRRDGDDALIAITDTGGGIPPAIRDRIFEPFFTTKHGAGTGLGLSISHRIITSAGGTITAEHRPERGTVFRVVLPAAESW